MGKVVETRSNATQKMADSFLGRPLARRENRIWGGLIVDLAARGLPAAKKKKKKVFKRSALKSLNLLGVKVEA